LHHKISFKFKINNDLGLGLNILNSHLRLGQDQGVFEYLVVHLKAMNPELGEVCSSQKKEPLAELVLEVCLSAALVLELDWLCEA